MRWFESSRPCHNLYQLDQVRRRIAKVPAAVIGTDHLERCARCNELLPRLLPLLELLLHLPFP
ncbi:hypothetical protein U8L64_00500, partial [Pseudomonas sp. FIP_A4]|uniref:hypothetical protein n=1 Tax=Pseudomonas sp. FIP_A4 TaxID=3070684 RepID=UPI002FCF92C4